MLDVQQGDSWRRRLVPQGASVQALWTDADTPRSSGACVMPVHVERTRAQERALRSTLAAGEEERHLSRWHIAFERTTCVRTLPPRPASSAHAGDIATVPRRASWRDVLASGWRTWGYLTTPTHPWQLERYRRQHRQPSIAQGLQC
eukprot:COSAG01_NODE_10744_length_2090_cov_6.850326_2_plen_146_part_00